MSCLGSDCAKSAAGLLSADSPDAPDWRSWATRSRMVLDAFMATVNPTSLDEVEVANSCLTCLDRLLYRDRMTLSQVL